MSILFPRCATGGRCWPFRYLLSALGSPGEQQSEPRDPQRESDHGPSESSAVRGRASQARVGRDGPLRTSRLRGRVHAASASGGTRHRACLPPDEEAAFAQAGELDQEAAEAEGHHRSSCAEGGVPASILRPGPPLLCHGEAPPTWGPGPRGLRRGGDPPTVAVIGGAPLAGAEGRCSPHDARAPTDRPLHLAAAGGPHAPPEPRPRGARRA